MDGESLRELADEHLARAQQAPARRSAVTVHGGHENALKQTLVALLAGTRLGEHESPPEATLQVLRGRVRLHADEESWEADAGRLLVIPPQRHDLEALEDAVVLLTVSVHGVPGT